MPALLPGTERARMPEPARAASGRLRLCAARAVDREAPIDALIDRIYDAALDPTLWDSTLIALADELAAASCIFVGHQEGSWTDPRFGHFGRLEPEINIRGTREAFGASPFAPRMAGLPAGRIVASDAILALADAGRTEWYRDIMMPQDIAHCLMTTLLREHGTFGAFFVARSVSKGPFAEGDIRALDRLVPHLTRAAHIRCRLDSYRVLAGKQQTLLDLLDTGIIVIDEAGAARSVNRAAEETIMAGGGLQMRGTSVLAQDPRAGAELHRLIGLTAAGGAGAMLGIPRGDSIEPLLVLVCPLRGIMRDRLGDPHRPRAAVALFLRDPTREAAMGLRDVLMQFYGLTPGEARIADALAKGHGIASVARRLALSPNTVKMHAKRVYNKTGMAGQAELAQLFGRLTAPVRTDAAKQAA